MYKILIIDDEPDFCFFVKKNLEARGDYDVYVCTDGREALQTAKKLQPDLILLDIIQPHLSGSEIAEMLGSHASTAHIPYIFLTAVVQEEETRRGRDVIGGRYFVAKPLKVEKLVSIIENVRQQKERRQ